MDSEARAQRIKELRNELQMLLDEEARENCDELNAVKRECLLLLKAGRRWDALKLYREKTGLSMSETLVALTSTISFVELYHNPETLSGVKVTK